MRRETKKDGTTVLDGLTLADILLAVHPVGCIYVSVSSQNPESIFGGTWVAWGSGRVPVGVDGTTDFNTVEKTGGEKTHTLTTTEIPSHDHQLDSTNQPVFVNNPGGTGAASGNNWGIKYPNTQTKTQPAGGGQPHNNLQPYITCYMWKRTA